MKIKQIVTVALSSILFTACNGGGGSYQSKPNNFPQIDCNAYAYYNQDGGQQEPRIKGNLSVTPVAPSPYGTDSSVSFLNSGSGNLGVSLGMTGLSSTYSGAFWLYDYYARTLNTTSSTPLPAGVCTTLDTFEVGSIYKGAVMYWTNCQAPVENGTMYFSADYQIIESTGATITTGKLSFTCSVESSNQVQNIPAEMRAFSSKR